MKSQILCTCSTKTTRSDHVRDTDVRGAPGRAWPRAVARDFHLPTRARVCWLWLRVTKNLSDFDMILQIPSDPIIDVRIQNVRVNAVIQSAESSFHPCRRNVFTYHISIAMTTNLFY